MKLYWQIWNGWFVTNWGPICALGEQQLKKNQGHTVSRVQMTFIYSVNNIGVCETHDNQITTSVKVKVQLKSVTHVE